MIKSFLTENEDNFPYGVTFYHCSKIKRTEFYGDMANINDKCNRIHHSLHILYKLIILFF